MILRNGRTIIGSLEAIAESHVVLLAENQKLKRELAQAQRMQAEVAAQRDDLKKHIEWMHEEMRRVLAMARQQAEQNVRELYRERDVAKAKAANRHETDVLH